MSMALWRSPISVANPSIWRQTLDKAMNLNGDSLKSGKWTQIPHYSELLTNMQKGKGGGILGFLLLRRWGLPCEIGGAGQGGSGGIQKVYHALLQ